MTRRSAIEIKATAYHEAGHGVACVVQGHPVKNLTVVPNATSFGHYVRPSVRDYDCQTVSQMRKVARELILVCYAGWPAEQRCNPDADEWRSKRDYDQAFNLSREFEVFPRSCTVVGDEFHQKYLAELKEKARRLVRRHWNAVEALAAELLKRKTLDKDAIERTVQPILVGIRRIAH